MSDLEFRAFDPRINQYIDSDDIAVCGDGVVLQFTEPGEYVKRPDIIIERYTGLKDKNGKEIYKGDLWKRGEFIGVVTFEYSGWHIVMVPGSKCYEYPAFYGQAPTGAVIGNIHQNPELL